MSSKNYSKIKFKDNTPAQFVRTLLRHREAAQFIVKHRLWDGFWKYGWVSKLLIGLGILFGLKFMSIIWNWWGRLGAPESQGVVAEMGFLVQDMALESYHFLFAGSLKYIMLLILEVIIFHICRRTSEILTGQTSELSFKIFINAQVRMFKVVIRSYGMEMLFTIGIKVVLGIFGFLEFLQPVFIFGVQCYYLGFLVLDNYNEQFHLTIKESVKYARSYVGVCLAAGLVLNFLLFVPVIGPIFAPMLAAVAVSLIMYELSDLHLRPLPQEQVLEATKEENISRD